MYTKTIELTSERFHVACAKTRDLEVCRIFAGGVAHVAIVGKISQKSAPYSKYSRKCLRAEF